MPLSNPVAVSTLVCECMQKLVKALLLRGTNTTPVPLQLSQLAGVNCLRAPAHQALIRYDLITYHVRIGNTLATGITTIVNW